MIVINPEQQAALNALSRENFIERVTGHLQRFFPQHCAALGPDGVREAIDHGIDRAGGYGIVGERDVVLYLDLMFAFGRDFDTDPNLPWAAAILTDERIPAPKQRINRLHAAALAHTADAAQAQGG